jgi:hypothetical protein
MLHSQMVQWMVQMLLTIYLCGCCVLLLTVCSVSIGVYTTLPDGSVDGTDVTDCIYSQLSINRHLLFL